MSSNSSALVVVPRNNNNGKRGNRVVVLRPENVVSVRRAVGAPGNPRAPGQGVSRNARRRRSNGNNSGRSAMQVPSVFGQGLRGGAPRFMAGAGPGVVRVNHREVLTDVTGTSSFSSIAFGQNAGGSTWLSGVAQNFSRFRWLDFRVHYSTVAGTSDRGDVSLGVIYDAWDSLPRDMSEASALANSVTIPVWSSSGNSQCELRVDCSRTSKSFYNYLALDEAKDMSPSDLATFVPFWLIVSKQTSLNGQLVGRVYVDYTVELSDPIPARLNTTPSIRATGLRIRSEQDPEPAPEPDQMTLVIEGLRLLASHVQSEKDDENEASPSKGS